MATLDKIVPEKLLSNIDKAIDSKNIDRAYELVGCSNPQHEAISWLQVERTGCKECSMLGIRYKGVDSDLAQYPKCVLSGYINERKELRSKIKKS